MPPLVSVLVPAFNAAPYIAETLHSVLAQTWADIEVIVVDDGSQDATLAVAKAFQSPRVQVLSQPNQGAPVARNRALAEAQGEYIQFLDADDLLAPNKIEVQLQRLSGQPGAIAACPWARFVDRPENTLTSTASYWQDMAPTDWLIRCWEDGGMMHPGVWLAPHGVLARAGPWDTSLRRDQDGEYFCRAVLASEAVLFCEGTMSYYRSGLPGSISSSRSEVAHESYLRSAVSRAENLLRAENSHRTRRACCRTLEDFVYAVYPDYPHLWQPAWDRVKELAGPYFSPQGGLLLRIATVAFGWRISKRLQWLGRPFLCRIRRATGC